MLKTNKVIYMLKANKTKKAKKNPKHENPIVYFEYICYCLIIMKHKQIM